MRSTFDVREGVEPFFPAIVFLSEIPCSYRFRKGNLQERRVLLHGNAVVDERPIAAICFREHQTYSNVWQSSDKTGDKTGVKHPSSRLRRTGKGDFLTGFETIFSG